MTDNEIIKALETCSRKGTGCQGCPYLGIDACIRSSMLDALALIQRQQKKIDELTDREAVFSFDRIHRNIAELNLILEGYNVAELKKRFRECFEEQMELGIEDCINWADWLDSIASEMWKEVKSNDR